MREIKFRAWSTIKGPQMVWLNPTNCGGSMWDLISDDTWQVMQFTGLLDSKGVDVYDGDVIQDPSHGARSNCVIKYEEGAFYANSVINPEDGSNELASEYVPEAIVIGNIHENPDLLNMEA